MTLSDGDVAALARQVVDQRDPDLEIRDLRSLQLFSQD